MSCSEEALAAIARGELAGPSLAAMGKHLASCADCALELDWLVRERSAIARVVAPIGALPPLEPVLARVVPSPARPRFAWLSGVLALGLAPAAALLTILTVGSTLPVTAASDGELATIDPAPACFLGGDSADGDVARLEAMFAACLVASPGPSRRDDRGVTEALFSPHGREACE